MLGLFSSFDINKPLYIYSIPVIWLASFYPHGLKFLKIETTLGYNNARPRWNNSKTLENKVTANEALQYERLEGAHNNGNEAMPLWFAAVLAANVAGVDNQWMNSMALTYVATRFIYNTVYIYFNDIWGGYLRSFLYFFGLSYPLRILFKAAARFNN